MSYVQTPKRMTKENTFLIIFPEVRRLDASNAGAFQKEIEEAFAKSKQVVLILKNLEFIDSTGLGIMIALARKADTAGIVLRFACPHEQLQDSLKYFKLPQVMRVWNSLDEAIIT